MFAALYAPPLPAAALVDVARAFTPRFEQVGPLVLLDAGGLSRLFSNAQELGAHLSQALAKHGSGGAAPRVAVASTQTAAALLALGRPGLTVVEPGNEAKALAPLSVSVLDLYATDRLTIVESLFLLVDGVLQNQDGVTSIKAERVSKLDGLADDAAIDSHDFH